MNPLPPPLATEAAHCGFPSPAEDHHEGRLSLEKRLIRHPAATFFVRAEGRSMEPLIYAGDILLVDRSLTPRDQDVVVAVVDGGFVVKRFHAGGHQAGDGMGGKGRAVKDKMVRFILKSDNEDHGSEPTMGDEDVLIWGVVSSIIRELHPIGS